MFKDAQLLEYLCDVPCKWYLAWSKLDIHYMGYFAWIFFRMPTLSDACGVIGRIFDFSLPKTFFTDSMTTMFFMVLGIVILLIKEVLDEFYPSMKAILIRPIWLRWGGYLVILSLILLAGVLGSDQFIYANF